VNKITGSLFFRKAFAHSGDVRGLLKRVSRKGAKKITLRLCSFAPLREKKINTGFLSLSVPSVARKNFIFNPWKTILSNHNFS
jgi:hypothetical protein